MDSVEYLVQLHETINELWDELAEKAPETTEKLRSCLGEVESAQDSAKVELRSAGPGNHKIGEFSFQVKTGGTKTIFDIEDVLMEAEDNGHLKDLINAGFVEYSVNAKQLDRLPAMIKPIYQEMAKTKSGTARVYMPKNLCK